MCRWKEKVLVPIANKTANLLLTQFQNHREGRPVEMLDYLKTAVDSFIKADDPIVEIVSPTINYELPREHDIELYKETFEKPLQASTLDYYRRKAEEWSNVRDGIELIENVANLISKERTLLEKVMHPSTVVAAEHWAAEILLKNQLKHIKLDFKTKMNKDVFEETSIKKCFSVLKLIDNGLYDLINEFKVYVIDETTSKIGDHMSEPKIFVNVVAEGSRKFKKIVEKVFDNHSEFLESMNVVRRSFYF